MEKKALGKGLGALLPESPLHSIQQADRDSTQEIPLDQIMPNRYQPRRDFDESVLANLAESVKQNGVLQPVLVRRKADGFFELIAGERRYRAAKLAGLKTIPAIVRNTSDKQTMELALVENLQRADLNPIEEAHAYYRLVTEFGLMQDALVERFGKDRSSIANSIRLLNLPNEIKELVESLKLSPGHAKVLLGLSRPDVQLRLAKRIVDGQLSVRQTERLAAAESRSPRSRLRTKRPQLYPDLEEKLQRRLGTKVMIAATRKGGKIEIHYYSPEDLDRLVDMMLG